MATEEQIAANRANAQKSTGPRTAAGKARSRINATKHGLTGQQIVLPGEDPAEYDAFKADLFEELAPVGPLEERLVTSIAQNMWRVGRAPGFESAVLANGEHRLADVRQAAKDLFGTDKSELAADETLVKLYPHRAKDDLKRQTFLGQVIENNLSSLIRLSTYEGKLATRVKQDLKQLRELQAERKAVAAKGIVEEDGDVNGAGPVADREDASGAPDVTH